MKVYVNNRGWVMGIERKNGDMIGLKFTRHKEGAKPFRGDWLVDDEAQSVLYYIENTLKCAYFKYMA